MSFVTEFSFFPCDIEVTYGNMMYAYCTYVTRKIMYLSCVRSRLVQLQACPVVVDVGGSMLPSLSQVRVGDVVNVCCQNSSMMK